MSETNLDRLHAIVEGRVQGVGFRYFTAESAIGLGLSGWVRNRWDGVVELVAEGERSKLEKLVGILWKGPRSSFVTQVKVVYLEATGEYKGFSIRQTV